MRRALRHHAAHARTCGLHARCPLCVACCSPAQRATRTTCAMLQANAYSSHVLPSRIKHSREGAGFGRESAHARVSYDTPRGKLQTRPLRATSSLGPWP
jgi:hypothetical protein